ncbi:hypothetical protein CEXT_190261 [Caerostris extrusa]|uniref:Ycf15 n=1 Tax=Caerostris extrusa TaxID=172846 RepID=A0AAV4RHA7_CAEEX|nr:hypothetical protein CEXT_190261 [Caerostris extrusa]
MFSPSWNLLLWVKSTQISYKNAHVCSGANKLECVFGERNRWLRSAPRSSRSCQKYRLSKVGDTPSKLQGTPLSPMPNESVV